MYRIPAISLEQKIRPVFLLWELYRPHQEVEEPAASTVLDIPSQIRQLAALRDEGLISDEEYAAKKHELLERM